MVDTKYTHYCSNTAVRHWYVDNKDVSLPVSLRAKPDVCTITMFGNSDGQYRLVDHNSYRVREAVTTRGQDHRRYALVDDEIV